MPTIVYFVRPHNEKKWTQQSTFTGKQLKRRNIQWLLCKWECSNATYITPQITQFLSEATLAEEGNPSTHSPETHCEPFHSQ